MNKIISYRITITAAVLFIANAVIAVCGSNFSGERLEVAVMDYLNSSIEYEHEIDLMTIINDRSFDENGVTAQIDHYKDLRGMTSIDIIYKLNEQILERDKINLRIKLYAEIPIAATDIEKGKILSSEDIIYRKSEITIIDTRLIPQKNDILGKLAIEKIFQGKPLLKNQFTADVMLTRGEKVEIIVYSGAVQIRTYGTAMNDARFGEMIRVKRDGSGNKMIHGRVSQDGKVIITTGYDLTGGNN
jgi:flagella basal body P-ring formation protein FlgA